MQHRKTAAFLAAGLLSLGTAFALPIPEETVSASTVAAAYADASGDVLSGAVYTIMIRLSGKYLTASDGNVQQWESLGTAAQQWRIVRTSDDCCAIFSAEDPALALTVEGADGTNGNNIALAEYTGSEAQQFYLTKVDDAYTIRARCSSSAVLDVYDISYENGANIDQWDYWGGEGQKFYIRPLDDTYTLLRADLDYDGKPHSRRSVAAQTRHNERL